MPINGNLIDSYHRLSTRRKIVTRALAIISVLLIIIILLTYYGTQTGNFVVTIEGKKYQSLSLSDKEDRSDQTARLLAKSMRDCHDADYSYIPTDIEQGIGTKNDYKNYRYFAYSFYLINSGDIAVNYSMNINIVRAEKQLDSILRVMIIKDGEETIYAKAREDEGHQGEPEGVYIDEKGYAQTEEPLKYTVPFIEDASQTIISQINYDFAAGAYAKYTCVIWLDGWDKQETDFMQGGAIQTELVFKIIT
jgi:hypothetical protein